MAGGVVPQLCYSRKSSALACPGASIGHVRAFWEILCIIDLHSSSQTSDIHWKPLHAAMVSEYLCLSFGRTSFVALISVEASCLARLLVSEELDLSYMDMDSLPGPLKTGD